MASSVTPLLIAARGHSTRGRRPVDLQNHPLKSFLAASHRPCRPSGPFNTRNRLSTFTRAGAASAYTWDANGNRLSSIETTRADTDLDGAFDAEDFSATTAQSLTIAEGSNRLLGFTQTLTNVRGTRALSTTSAQVAYTLDAAGNLTSDGLRSFNHDASGRLAQVRIGLGSEEAATVYLHNALGQRVFKSEPQATQYAPDEEELGSDFINWLKKNFGWLFAKAQANATLGQSFVYADAPLPPWALLGEYGNGGSKSAGRLEILWLPTEDGNVIPVGLYRNGRFHAIHPDHLGTPRLITDDAAKPVWQWPYSAFGANKPSGILKATPKPKQAWTNEPVFLKATNPALTFNLRFPGQYWDEESNLSYNYFRNYMPTQGRYSQADPIGLDGGLNRFGYVGGVPLSFTDPLGLQSGGPYHQPEGVSLKCTDADSCPDIQGKLQQLKRMIDSHEGWDRHNPAPNGGGRHAIEIADLWKAYARCQALWAKKDCDNCKPESFLDWLNKQFGPKTKYEPPRVLRRLQLLRRWSHEQVTEVLPGSPRARRAHGAGAPSRLPVAVGSD